MKSQVQSPDGSTDILRSTRPLFLHETKQFKIFNSVAGKAETKSVEDEINGWSVAEMTDTFWVILTEPGQSLTFFSLDRDAVL